MPIVDVQYEGLEQLADVFQNAPELVAEIAEKAGKLAAPVVGEAIRAVTPVLTGLLQSTVHVALVGPFNLEASASTAYADVVNDRTQFLPRGIADAEGAVDAIYEAAMDELARRIGQ